MIDRIKMLIKLIQDFIHYKNLDPDNTVLDETEKNIYDDIVPKA